MQSDLLRRNRLHRPIDPVSGKSACVRVEERVVDNYLFSRCLPVVISHERGQFVWILHQPDVLSKHRSVVVVSYPACPTICNSRSLPLHKIEDIGMPVRINCYDSDMPLLICDVTRAKSPFLQTDADIVRVCSLHIVTFRYSDLLDQVKVLPSVAWDGEPQF